MTKTRKITNTSENEVGVKLTSGNMVFIKPKQVIENADVCNLDSVKRYLKVEHDLTEVEPVKEGKIKLFE